MTVEDFLLFIAWFIGISSVLGVIGMFVVYRIQSKSFKVFQEDRKTRRKMRNWN